MSQLKRLKFANFNLKNLVLPQHKYYGANVYTQEEYDKKVEWTAKQLRLMDADVVGFEEVFHEEALKEIIEKSGVYKNAKLCVFAGDGTSPRVAMVSRFPVLNTKEIRNFPPESRLDFDHEDIHYHAQITRFRHPILCSEIELPQGIKCRVFVAHLKSKRPIMDNKKMHSEYEFAIGKARSLMIRAAESTALRCILLNEIKNNHLPTIVMGDMNDSVHSVTSNIITNEPPPKKFDHARKKEIWKQLLYSTYDIQSRMSRRDIYYTYMHNGNYESLDHIFVSEEFYQSNPNKIARIEYMRIFNDHLVDKTLSFEKPPKWVSDHGQVLVSIKLQANSKTK